MVSVIGLKPAAHIWVYSVQCYNKCNLQAYRCSQPLKHLKPLHTHSVQLFKQCQNNAWTSFFDVTLWGSGVCAGLLKWCFLDWTVMLKQWGFMAYHEHVLVLFSFWLLHNFVSLSSSCLFIQPSAAVVLHHWDVSLWMDFSSDTFSTIWAAKLCFCCPLWLESSG